jgi:hypothetical protein
MTLWTLNKVEKRKGEQDERAFVHRSFSFDFCFSVFFLCHASVYLTHFV